MDWTELNMNLFIQVLWFAFYFFWKVKWEAQAGVWFADNVQHPPWEIPWMKCWGAWDTTWWAQSHVHHIIDHLEERCNRQKRGSAWRFSWEEWERAIISQTNTWTVSKATEGKLQRDGGSVCGLSKVCRYLLELNWTELYFSFFFLLFSDCWCSSEAEYHS